MSRIATPMLLVVAVALFAVVAVAKAADKTHEGKVVSITAGDDGKDGKIVMVDKDGKNEHSHAVLATAKITLNKKSAKLSDLKKNDLVTVTLNDAKKVAELAATRDAN